LEENGVVIQPSNLHQLLAQLQQQSVVPNNGTFSPSESVSNSLMNGDHKPFYVKQEPLDEQSVLSPQAPNTPISLVKI
jgi:hypothetical protein